LLWAGIHQKLEQRNDSESEYEVLQLAIANVLGRQAKVVAIPKRASIPMREVWSLQSRFRARRGARPYRLLEHARFRAAYDFLLLRAETGTADPELAEWWTVFQTANPTQRRKMTQQGKRKSPANKKTAEQSELFVETEALDTLETVSKSVSVDPEG
jgi:poly(A) polymerase